MSSANLDLVRSIYAAWEHGDFGSLDWAHPEIEFVIVGGPDPGNWTGLTGMADGWRGWLSAWENYAAQADEYHDLDGQRVLALGRMSGRGKASGVHVETEFANVFQISGGKVVRLRLYSSRVHALADLGLDEQAVSPNYS